METVAVIDLGSNSARLAVFEIRSPAEYILRRRAFEMIRLAASLTEEGFLSKDAFVRTAEALAKLKQVAAQYRCSVFRCIATEAVRRAKNSAQFLDFLREQTGLAFTVISGEKEAQYGFSAVREGLGLSDFVLMDTGGASVEISLVKGGTLRRSISLPVGSLSMHRAFIHSDPVSTEDLSALKLHLCESFQSVPWLAEGKNLPVAGLGGANKCMAKLDCPGREFYQRYTLTAKRIAELYETVSHTAVPERALMPGMESGREDTILSGMTAAVVLMDLLASPEMVISEWGLDYGVFIEYWIRRKEEAKE